MSHLNAKHVPPCPLTWQQLCFLTMTLSVRLTNKLILSIPALLLQEESKVTSHNLTSFKLSVIPTWNLVDPSPCSAQE